MPQIRLPLVKQYLFVLAITLGIAGCGGGNDRTDINPEDAQTPPPPQDTFNYRIFVLGSEMAPDGSSLALYASATKEDGSPITLEEFNNANIALKETDTATGAVTSTALTAFEVTHVTDGDQPVSGHLDSYIMSISLLTDYSNSVPEAALQSISAIYTNLLNALPKVYKAQVIDFATTLRFRQEAFTDDLILLQQAVQYKEATGIGVKTALYDAIGAALHGRNGPGAEPSDGLIEQCTPVHLLVVFADGEDNASIGYTQEALLQAIDASKTKIFFLTLEDAYPGAFNLATIKAFTSGTRGAFVYAHDTNGITEAMARLTASLQNMVRIHIVAPTGVTFNMEDGIGITLGGTSTTIELKDNGTGQLCF